MIYWWLGWIFFVVAMFIVLESYAIIRDRLTLSRFTYNITSAFPPLIFLMGMLAGGLVVHFWWHWCPNV